MTTTADHFEFASQEIIRPAAVLSEAHARMILAGLATHDVRRGGVWWSRVGTWRRYASPWVTQGDDPATRYCSAPSAASTTVRPASA